MPSNSRPTMFDPVWSKRSLAEIEAAQNQWDLVKAQEEANEIARNQLNNNINLESYDSEDYWQEQNDRFKEYLRTSICDIIGIDYDDMMEFIDKLKNSDAIIKRDKESLINNIKWLEDVIRSCDEQIADPSKITVDTSEKEEHIKELEEHNKQLSRSLLSSLFNKSIIAYNINTINSIKADIEAEKEDIKHNLQKYIDNLKKNKEAAQKQLPKYKADLKKLESLDIKKDFNNFRKTHYNKQMEQTLNAFHVELPEIKDIKNHGTVNDYVKYIEKVLGK